MGAWVSYGLGSENENLPAYVTICPTLAHGGGSKLGVGFFADRAPRMSDRQRFGFGRQGQDPSYFNGKLTFVQQRSQLAMIGP